MLDALRQNPVFAHASDDALVQLVRASVVRRYDRRQLVIADGDSASTVFVLLRGAVRVFHSVPDALQVTLKIFRAPAVFGEAEALSDLPTYIENVEALETTEILAIPAAAMLTILRAHPQCAVDLALDLAKRLAIAIYTEKSLAFNPVTMRLANYLLDYGAWSNDEGETEPRIDLSQDDLAIAIGATRRSVAKDMIAWQADGILTRQGRHYVVRDLERLRALSDPRRLSLTHSQPPTKRRSRT